MANYTQYIPQVNSTTYPTSISNCFTALTSDVTALETEVINARNGEANLLDSINLKLNLSGGAMTGIITNFTSIGIDDNATATAITIDASNNILVGGTIDGRDLATDGTQLDANTTAIALNTIKLTANTTNVTAAGALMDSEVDTNIKTLVLPTSTTISTFGASLVDDANAAAALATLGLDTDLSTISVPASTTISTFGASLVDDANATAARTTLVAASSGVNTDITSLQSSITATTQTASDNSTKLATTAFVKITNAGLNTKVIDIGDWNMDVLIAVSVIHGLTSSKIRAISVLIRHDNDINVIGFPADDAASTSDEFASFDTVNIVLSRGTAGYFDNTGYDSTSYNRGWITIQYVD